MSLGRRASWAIWIGPALDVQYRRHGRQAAALQNKRPSGISGSCLLACLLTRLPCLGLALQFGFWTKKVSPGRASGIFGTFLFSALPHVSPSPCPLSHPIIVLHLKTTPPASPSSISYKPSISQSYVASGIPIFILNPFPLLPLPIAFLPPSSPLVWSNPTSQDQPLCIQTSKSRDSNALSHRFYLPAHILRHDRFRRFSTIDSFFACRRFRRFPQKLNS